MIVQIIPATGFVATFSDGEALKVIAWGLQDDGDVVPLVATDCDLSIATDISGFEGIYG